MYPRRLLLISALVLHSGAAFAHEFWIEPNAYNVKSGDAVKGDLRNGQEFDGISLAYFDNRFTRFDVVNGDDVVPVEGRLGDNPALSAVAGADGLMIVVHETMPSTITYKTWEKFATFAKHKDFAKAQEDHTTAGWPTSDFKERYTRHAKALIGVGSGEGADRALGLETEFVAMTNPYADGFDGQMRVSLLYQGSARMDAQVEVFERAPDDTVAITMARTDVHGEAVIAVKPGHTYLFDAVVLRPAPDSGETENSPLWETLWAALTFAVPD
ncbi:MAG: DUF4198 domain-containing protein [Sulfitobacter sp.]